MRSSNIVNGQRGLAQQFDNLRHDAAGGGFLHAHQMLGYLSLPDAPTNSQTITLDINGNNIVLTAVGSIGSTAGNILNPGTAATFAANVLALLQQPQTTTANGVALSAADQQFLSYLSFSLVGTTIYFSSNNLSLFAPLSSFTISTTVGSASWTAQTMQLYVEPGVVYVGGTRVIFSGGSTPTVTAPSGNPRIDVLTIDNTGTLAWTTGTEASSPSAPSYPANKVPLCELYNVVGETALYDNANQTSGQGYISNDVRAFLQTSMNWTAFASDLIPDGSGTRNLGSSGNPWDYLYVNNIVANVVSYNYQNFTTSGTWTKPSGLIGTEIVIVQMWGAGGGGGLGGSAGGGGGGGACVIAYFTASALPSTVTVTVGAGGASATAGGNTTFGSYLTAYGGGSGSSSTGSVGGGGGGALSAGTSATSASGNGGGPGGGNSSVFDSSGYGGGYGAGGNSAYGGGGGGSTSVGGNSLYGGAGGGAAGNSLSAGNNGGTSVLGGAGGAGGGHSGAGSNGTAPGGGGGGGSAGANGGSGAAGQCQVWVIT